MILLWFELVTSNRNLGCDEGLNYGVKKVFFFNGW